MEPFSFRSNFRESGFRDRNKKSGENNPMILDFFERREGGLSRHIGFMRKGVSRDRIDPG
ncbi:hypothetical protein IQ16_00240 [Bradyrhizobium huanghuaihaiense]|uniref:Uncharacterized protein n=1 Tax=Bradyrhizobium huanghuaihaiense TaxID=990078 RepID=A0A562S452_9BRAD|nr:hypothetical protein IQ16_00240 [Bradyrhizobium huanghuaihaiense]